MAVSSAPGNIFLLGEHSVVYGRSAIIAAIGLKTFCRAEKISEKSLEIASAGYGKFESKLENLKKPTEYQSPLDPIIDLFAEFSGKFNLKTGVRLEISSNIPRNSGGMSSSTAVLSSVLDALNKLRPCLEKESYYGFLLPFQQKIHGGKASGAEIFSSTFGGYNKIRINPLQREGLGNIELPIMIVNTGVEAKTAETVPYVKSGWTLDMESYEEVFDRIQSLVEEGEKAIKTTDLVKLGKLMSENHQILAYDLGVSHPKLNKVIKVALDSGAYGAKLSGGGKGGAAIILADKTKQEKIAERLSFCHVYKTEIGVAGL
ncbi:MAG: mevalonate kinase [Candidatus Aenigmarchaeota archaeon]|nr:mevalonate kinase [Candidatus Aenigmarchaeota archaeon]